jgi:peptidylprolyl isomerase/FKBP-type peptidyl-prolyl cis-trans isomerase FklB
MKHYFYFILAFISLSAAFSCSKDDDDKNSDAWKSANEEAFNAIKTDPEYSELKSPGNEGSIYYKVLTEGTDTKPIYYTSTVSIYIKGYYIVENNELGIKKNDLFQRKEFDDGSPVTILVSAPDYLPAGISVALQYMKKGDKWALLLPYQLGFGNATASVPFDLYDTSATIAVPAFSTLAYEIEVVDIIQ